MAEMAVLGREGDTKVMWDPGNADEVENARDTFNKLTKKGHLAFSVKNDGEKDKQIREFDPKAGKIILVPRFVGG